MSSRRSSKERKLINRARRQDRIMQEQLVELDDSRQAAAPIVVAVQAESSRPIEASEAPVPLHFASPELHDRSESPCHEREPAEHSAVLLVYA